MHKKLSKVLAFSLSVGIASSICIGTSFPEAEAVTEVHEPTIMYEEPLVIPTPEPEQTNSEIYKLTAYCKESYPHICNNGDSTSTATGTTPTVGRTIAVDPQKIPYGSEVTINGHTYIAEDCGGAVKGNRIDILFDTHQEALNFGVQYAEVFIKEV